MPAQETEWEELIRKGHMTPFGTRVPQKEVKKEPRKVMLAENSAFDQYLSDQAKLATERKKVPFLKKRSLGLSPDGQAKANRTISSSKDKKLRKRMRKLQITSLKAHPKARPKAEPQPNTPRKRHHTEEQATDSEGSEYLPSDEVLDPDQQQREAMEEGFGEEDDDDEYELKPYKRKTEGKGRKKAKKKEESEDEYCPESSEEEEEEKGKAKRCKDDGDVEYYRQRVRYDCHTCCFKLV